MQAHPCPECGAEGECAHRERIDPAKVAAIREKRDRESDAHLRATLEAARDFHSARDETKKRERDPRALVRAACGLALSRVGDAVIRERVAAIAAIKEKQAAAFASLAARASDLARSLPTREEWERFYEKEIVPASSLRGEIRWCTCGAPFVATKARKACSDACTARERMRGRNTKKARKSATTNALNKHAAQCGRCKRGEACAQLESILSKAPSTDALSHLADDLTPEDGEEMISASGRTRAKRSP